MMPPAPRKPSNAPICPRCQTSNTELMMQRSASDVEFNHFSCNACGQMWIVRKPAAPSAAT